MALVKPPLKKSNMDPFDLKSYRPISNLPFLSKVIERLAVDCFTQHVETNSLLPSRQSAYRANHSTETAVTAVINDIARAVDTGMVCAMVLLDLTAAFDTVDHSILLDVLHKRFSVCGSALDWFSSYQSDRMQVVCIGPDTSIPSHLKCGVAQGSTVGPKEFISYTEDIQELVNSHSLAYHLYADDIQLLSKMQVDEIYAQKGITEQCIAAVHKLMLTTAPLVEWRED